MHVLYARCVLRVGLLPRTVDKRELAVGSLVCGFCFGQMVASRPVRFLHAQSFLSLEEQSSRLCRGLFIVQKVEARNDLTGPVASYVRIRVVRA